MPRPPRITYENAWYHIMNRAGAKRFSFLKNAHRQLFLDLLDEITIRFDLEIHAYCLMGNHFHLLIKTPKANISEAMHRLLFLYTRRFNRLEKLDGPLFRGRFKAIVIAEEEYLYQVSRYIHLNPVEANLCQQPDKYPWSSYSAYVGQTEAPSWLHTDFILGQFGQTRQRHFYREFVENSNQPSLKQFYAATHTPSILGSKEARKKLYTKSILNQDEEQPPHLENPLQKVAINLCCDASELLKSQRGKKNALRDEAMWLLRHDYGLKINAIAELFCLRPTTVSTALARCVNT